MRPERRRIWDATYPMMTPAQPRLINISIYRYFAFGLALGIH